MDFRQLRHFLAVADLLHFGKAADHLGMTQPPLSQSIRNLEEELGVVLFERNKRRVALTDIGAAWLPYARSVVEAGADLPDIAARLSRGEIGTLRLAFVSYAAYRLVPPLLRRFSEICPELQVILQEATTDTQIAGLIEGSFDLGIIITPPALPPGGLAVTPLKGDELVAVVPDQWLKSGQVRAHQGRISFTELEKQRLIVFPRPSAPALFDLISDYYRSHGAKPVRGQEAIQMQTIINLVAEGLGFALVPEPMTELQRRGVTYLRLEDAGPVCQTALAWREDRALPSLMRLVATARSTVSEAGPLLSGKA